MRLVISTQGIDIPSRKFPQCRLSAMLTIGRIYCAERSRRFENSEASRKIQCFVQNGEESEINAYIRACIFKILREGGGHSYEIYKTRVFSGAFFVKSERYGARGGETLWVRKEFSERVYLRIEQHLGG